MFTRSQINSRGRRGYNMPTHSRYVELDIRLSREANVGEVDNLD